MSRGDCECFCGRWGHVGICTGLAVHTVTFEGGAVLGHEKIECRFCEPCAEDVAAVTQATADESEVTG